MNGDKDKTMSRVGSKELFKSMNISRPRLYQIIGQLDNTQRPHKDSKGRYIFDNEAVEHIKQYYSHSIQSKNEEKSVHSNVYSIVISLTKQLKIKDQQVAELHKLLDQQQQLNLSTNEQNKKLLGQPAAKNISEINKGVIELINFGDSRIALSTLI